jgi:glycosyltransferase involved in cell wall biosynthesis
VRGAARHLPVVVVDDGSADGTARVAEAAGARVLRQTPNQGKGAALRTGFRLALAEGIPAVVTLDADGQHDPGEIPKLVAAFAAGRPDLVIGCRDFGAMPPLRRLANTLGSLTLRLALGEWIRDNQSGFRLVGRRIMEALASSGESGFEFEVEMIAECLRRGWPIEWVPIRTIYAGGPSHIRNRDHLVGFLRTAWRLRGSADRRKAAERTG